MNSATQGELALNVRKLDHLPAPEKEDPESTLVQDTLGPVLQAQLSPAEYARIERAIKRLDWNLDIIERDRKIKHEIRHRVRNRMNVKQAVEEVAGLFFLSEEHVFSILYEKREKEKKCNTQKKNSNL